MECKGFSSGKGSSSTDRMPARLRLVRDMPRQSWSLNDLCSRAAARIASGQLPTAKTTTVIAGYGSNESLCHLCDSVISASEVEYRVPDARAGGRELVLHITCHLAWQVECTRAPPQPE
jgi:hypothetical protein